MCLCASVREKSAMFACEFARRDNMRSMHMFECSTAMRVHLHTTCLPRLGGTPRGFLSKAYECVHVRCVRAYVCMLLWCLHAMYSQHGHSTTHQTKSTCVGAQEGVHIAAGAKQAFYIHSSAHATAVAFTQHPQDAEGKSIREVLCVCESVHGVIWMYVAFGWGETLRRSLDRCVPTASTHSLCTWSTLRQTRASAPFMETTTSCGTAEGM